MTLVTTEQVVENGQGGRLTVRRDPQGVRVSWTCGDGRFFSKEQVKIYTEQLDTFKQHGDVWLALKDMSGYSVHARINSQGSLSIQEDRATFMWDEVKQALSQAMA